MDREVGYCFDTYEDDIVYIVESLKQGRPVYVPLAPGDGTRYSIMLAPLIGTKFPAGGVPGTDTSYVWVSTEQWGSYPFQLDGFLDPGYVSEHLRLNNQVSAVAITLFLNDVAWATRERMQAERGNWGGLMTEMAERYPVLFDGVDRRKR